MTASETPAQWFDALAHTITTDGDLARCAECGEYGSHAEHQPEALAEAAMRTDEVVWSGIDADLSTGSVRASSKGISAPMVAALETAWSAIRARHPELPAVVIVLGGGSDRPGMVKLGHFAALRWATTPTEKVEDAEDTEDTVSSGAKPGDDKPLGEVFVGGEGLARGPVDVLGTLLHEAAHALADVRGVKDTSRQGRWHNARFKALAEELGIEVTKDPRLGWSPTTVTSAARENYSEIIVELGRALRMQRAIDGVGFGLPTGSGSAGDDGHDDGDQGDDGGEAGKRKTVPACVCGCGRRIRVAPTVLALGPIECGVCEQPFTPDTGETTSVDESGDGSSVGQDEGPGDGQDEGRDDELVVVSGVAS